MARLTSYESTQADAWDTGTAESDQAEEAREMSGLRAAWALVDGDVPQHPRNPAVPHWHDDRS